MAELEMCRICLAEDVRMHSVTATHLQQLYETLTMIPFETEDGRPTKACYICYARLENCYKLRTTCLKSEEVLGQLLRINMISSVKPEPGGSDVLGVTPVKHYNLGEVCDNPYQTLEIKKEETDYEEDTQENTTDDPIPLYPEVLIDSIKVEPQEEEATAPDTQSLLDLQGNLNDNTSSILDNHKQATIGGPKSATGVSGGDYFLTNSEYIIHTQPSERYDIQNKKTEIEVSVDLSVDFSYKPRHRKRIKPGLESDISDTTEKPYECSICEKRFALKENLNKHNRTHAGEKPYQCDVCKKRYTRKSNLNTHVRTHTGVTHTGEKAYQCHYCRICFEEKDDLREHMQVHSATKSYDCHICNKCFRKKDSLDKHIRTHTGEKPYQCVVCKRCYSQKGNLYVHIRTHTGEKPFQCDICKKCFNRKLYLCRHMRIHTNPK